MWDPDPISLRPSVRSFDPSIHAAAKQFCLAQALGLRALSDLITGGLLPTGEPVFVSGVDQTTGQLTAVGRA